MIIPFRAVAVIATLALGSGLLASGAVLHSQERRSSARTDTAAAQVLAGHTAGVTSVAFSPDGRWLISSGLDGTVRVWNAARGAQLRRLNHGSEVYSAAASADGRWIASTGGDRRIVVWSAATGAAVRAITLPTWSLAVAFTPSGELAVGSADGRVRIIDRQTGRVLREWRVRSEVMRIAISKDGRRLATTPGVTIWDLATGREMGRPATFGQGDIQFSPSGNQLASGEILGGARLFQLPGLQRIGRVNTFVERRALGPHGYFTYSANMPVTTVAFSPDGSTLATGGADRRVQLWAITGSGLSDTPTRVLAGHQMTVTGVAFSPDGAVIATSSLDRTVRIWRRP